MHIFMFNMSPIISKILNCVLCDDIAAIYQKRKGKGKLDLISCHESMGRGGKDKALAFL
jgi:hypothetical protein